ncbi:MAG TPA: S46 family peptidase [Salinivirgaceae bacterium]|nr:S46 family peptidase [Salinivirgaceae bacterium]
MRKLISLFAAFCLMASSHIMKADEGMWLPVLVNKLNIGHMTELGFKLTAEDVYSINQACLKDAIVHLHGCTGEFISSRGLLLTNHHCAYGDIQSHSSVEHDYLTNGFWAMTQEEELANPGKMASILIRAEDVTERFMSTLNDAMSELERYKVIDSLIKVIQQDVRKETPNYRASVTPLLHYNQFMLFVYQDFSDVRLVGAPPESIGKFGADTDNWMWPRHTGDFSLYRVYANKNNEPASYSPENVPYRPKSYLKISLSGIEEGDFTMIMGYPGRTNRYLTSWGVKNLMENSNALRAYIRGVKQDVWMKHMKADDAVRIKYASKYASSSNYWKYSIGQNQGLQNLNVIEKKQRIEQEFERWIDQSPDREKYKGVLSGLKESTITNEPLTRANTIVMETILMGSEGFLQAFRTYRILYQQMKDGDSAKIERGRKRIISMADEFYKDYDAKLDMDATIAMIEICMKELDPAYHPEFFKTIKTKYKGNVAKYLQKELAKSAFYDQQKFIPFIENATLKTLDKDPMIKIGGQISEIFNKINDLQQKNEESLARNYRLFVEGLMKMQPERKFYPDANSTMRLTYGTVGGYDPRDAVHYKYYTTLEGVMEKENPNEREFNVPARLKELYQNKDYGRYANKDGKMVVAFLANTDITGGNSGSPIMNARGELIGCAFDGNWEAMSGDIAFEPDYQRTISVDIRYVLFIIDKFAGAKHLIDEMDIVEN